MENEKKYTKEEIRAIVDEELRKANLKPARELSPDEMGHVAGGRIMPKTHEEVDNKWNAVALAMDNFGLDIASELAHDLGLINAVGGWGYYNDIQHFTIPVLRDKCTASLTEKM